MGKNDQGQWMVHGEKDAADTRLAQAVIEELTSHATSVEELQFFDIEIDDRRFASPPSIRT